MPENERLNRSIDQIELGFVEREATPEFLMKLSIQLHLSGLSLSNTVCFLIYSVLIWFDPLFIPRFTGPIYSRSLVGVRITLRSMRL